MAEWFSRNSIIRNFFSNIDWIMLFSALLISIAGLITMNSFSAVNNYFFSKQSIIIGLSVIVFFIASQIDYRFLRRTGVIITLYIFMCAVLLILIVIGTATKGAVSWFHFGLFAVQPTDPSSLVLVAFLAKYFNRRHIEIAYIKHIFISGAYAFLLFVLILFQPDFGSAIITFFVWLGMVLVSGISKKHLLFVFGMAGLAFFLLWNYGFHDYQRLRIKNFIHPLADIRGSGYNAYQATIAVGSGEIIGKGIGYGTQSKLQFLPEYETDFIFAAFAEEWGFVGVFVIFILFGIIVWRVLMIGMKGATNFEMLFSAGIAIIIISHFLVHVGINVGILPVTGKTLPFMSYGGSHLITEYFMLGILMGMRKYGREVHSDTLLKNEIPGITSFE